MKYVIPVVNGGCLGDLVCNTWLVDVQFECWMPLAMSDPGVVESMLMRACLSLDHISGSRKYEKAANQYKLRTIQSANQSLSSPDEQLRIDDAAISKTTMLLVDEVSDTSEVHTV